jgi:hypothetical protein
VVDFLIRKYKYESRTIVLCLYLSRSSRPRNAKDSLRAVLLEFFQPLYAPFEDIRARKLYNRYEGRAMTMTDVLIEIDIELCRYERVCLVLDAIDEMEAVQRIELLTCLRRFQPKFRIMVTGRPVAENDMGILAPFHRLEITGIVSRGLSDAAEHYGFDPVEGVGTDGGLGSLGRAVASGHAMLGAALNKMNHEEQEAMEQAAAAKI